MGLSARLPRANMKHKRNKPTGKSHNLEQNCNKMRNKLLSNVLHLLPSGNKGFTFIELIVVFGIVAVLFSIGYVAISSTQTTAVGNSSISVIISDIKSQQIKAMVGDTEGRGTPDTYGVKILPDSYVLFHGAVYDPLAPGNYSIPAPSGYTFSTTFPDTSIIFSIGSGEIVGFNPSQNTISLTNASTGNTKTIQFNKFGTVTNVN